MSSSFLLKRERLTLMPLDALKYREGWILPGIVAQCRGKAALAKGALLKLDHGGWANEACPGATGHGFRPASTRSQSLR